MVSITRFHRVGESSILSRGTTGFAQGTQPIFARLVSRVRVPEGPPSSYCVTASILRFHRRGEGSIPPRSTYWS